MTDRLDTLPCSFLSFGDDGIIAQTNHRLREILGYGPGDLEGGHIERVLSIGGKVFYHTHFFPLLKMQKIAEEVYFSLRSKSGEEVPMLVNAVRREGEGRPINECIFMRMRQRRRYEDELLRLKKEAERATAAKAKFLSMMSHDLRTPLQAISGFAEVLLQGIRGELTPAQKGDVAAIKAAGREMLRLMNDILSFAQLESGRVEVRLEPVRVKDALDRAVTLLLHRFDDHSLRLDRERADDELRIVADPDRLQQILLNLLNNAIKYTPAGGRVSVQTEPKGGRALIYISDTGIGIPEERLSDIFEPFVQVGRTVEQGVGLGLSISRDLARAMGGDLTVVSGQGQGATFILDLAAHIPVIASSG